MNAANFQKAITIIACHHSGEVKINTPINDFVGNLGTSDFRLHITKCVPAVVDELIAQGFMCNMDKDGLLVDHLA